MPVNFKDNFNRTDGFVANGWAGSTEVTVSSNVLTSSTATEAVVTRGLTGRVSAAQFTIPSINANGVTGIVFNFTDSSNMTYVSVYASSIYFQRKISGTVSTQNSGSFAYQAGDIFRVEVQGTVLVAKIIRGGVTVYTLSYDYAVSYSNSIGIRFANSGGIQPLDDFVVEDDAVNNVIFKDDFDRTDGSVGNGWTVTSGVQLVNNSVVNISGTVGSRSPIVRDFNSEGIIEATISAINAGSNCEIVFRYQDINNFYSFSLNNGTAYLAQSIAGVETILYSQSVGYGIGDVIGVIFYGANVFSYVKRNGKFLFYYNLTLGAISSAISAGLGMYKSSTAYSSISEIAFYSLIPFVDDFSRADGTVDNGWIASQGTPTILSNQITSLTVGGDSILVRKADSSGKISFDLSGGDATSAIDLVFRYASLSDYYVAEVYNGSVTLYSVISNSFISLGSTSYTLVVGDRLEVTYDQLRVNVAVRRSGAVIATLSANLATNNNGAYVGARLVRTGGAPPIADNFNFSKLANLSRLPLSYLKNSFSWDSLIVKKR